MENIIKFLQEEIKKLEKSEKTARLYYKLLIILSGSLILISIIAYCHPTEIIKIIQLIVFIIWCPFILYFLWIVIFIIRMIIANDGVPP